MACNRRRGRRRRADADAHDDAAASPAPTPTPGGKPAARAEQAQALTRLRAGRLEEAAQLFARAAEHDPGNASIATDYGFVLARLGKRAEAEQVLRSAIERDGKRFYAYVNLADLWTTDPARWEKRDAALSFLDKGLDAVKDDRKAKLAVSLAIAGFERAVGRTTQARARLAPLLAPEAPALSRAQRKRVLDLLDAIALDERAHALEDWPEPDVPAEDAARLDKAARSREPLDAIAALVPLVDRHPTWARARVARARALEAVGRVDEAARDLEIATHLAPSNAAAWRALGRLLAAHGGALELERADEALRQAITLEPAWVDLRDVRARLARRRAAQSPSTPARPAAGPSDKARALFQEAEEWIELGDPAGFGRDRLEQALTDSPGFVAAAVSLYALTGAVPKPTTDALADDGPGLWALASGVRKLARPGAGAGDAVDAEVRSWIDRAVALDVQEARFARAVSRAAAGDQAGALADLTAYVAREPDPEHLAEAQALRAGLGVAPAGRGEVRPSPQLLARIRLLEDQPEAALRALGGACAPGIPAERLLAIGMVHELGDKRAAARACFELAGDPGLTRLARLDARLPDTELASADPKPLVRAAGHGIAGAEWALARLAAATGDEATALEHTDRALALAARQPDEADVWIGAARATADRLAQARRAELRAHGDRRRRALFAAGVLALFAAGLLVSRRLGGATVATALRRRPGLYPEVARAIGEIRHDVLKHRAGVLGMIADAAAPRDEIARALTEPRPTSVVLAGIYDGVVTAARAHGIALRPLAREPVFGPLARALARAEGLLARGERVDSRAELLAIDARLRGDHADALADLLQLGPRTRLDAAALSTWIAATEAATRQGGTPWTPTALALADLDLDFPVDRDALELIFTNLLRNAQAAVAGAPDARVLVRVDRERDATGRQVVTLFVGDSASAPFTVDTIESREGGRGLAIVRDLVRAWRGQMVVRAEPAPLAKLVGASFPL